MELICFGDYTLRRDSIIAVGKSWTVTIGGTDIIKFNVHLVGGVDILMTEKPGLDRQKFIDLWQGKTKSNLCLDNIDTELLRLGAAYIAFNHDIQMNGKFPYFQRADAERKLLTDFGFGLELDPKAIVRVKEILS